MAQFQHLTRAILSRPWAIDPDSVAWAAICDVLALRASGERLTDEEIAARIAAAENGPRIGARVIGARVIGAAPGRGARSRNVAVLPVYGVITPRSSMMARSSGGTSAETVRDDFRAALEDPEVDGIVFDVDSPGGAVEGIGELADEIRAARGQKPIAAHANHMAASAAYWAMAGADEFNATPSATVGSIGVFTAHDDLTGAMDKAGVKRTIVKAGPYKAEGALGMPLGEEGIAALQDQVDAWYAEMTGSIAKGRGVGVEDVRSKFGGGRGVMAKPALGAGMIDRIGSIDETIRRVARGVVGAPAAGKAALYAVNFDGDLLAPGAGATFAERVEAVAAEAAAVAKEAEKRTEVRAEAGRELSPTTRTALATLSATLESLAAGAAAEDDPEPEPVGEPAEDEPEETPDPEVEASEPRRRRDLELLEAAARGGYTIPRLN